MSSMCSAIHPRCPPSQPAMRRARHLLPSSAVPPEPPATEQPAEFRVRLLALHPVVGRAGHVFAGRADEREVFAAGDVVGIAAVQVAPRELLLVQLDEDALLHALIEQRLPLGEAAVAPDDLV